MPRDTRAAYLRELDRLEPTLRDAFLIAVKDLRSASQVKAIEQAVAIGDWRAAIELLRMDERVFDRLDRAMQDAFYQGGVYQLAHLPPKPSPSGRGASLAVFFQGRTPRAEAWGRAVAGALISEIVEDQRETIRETIERGIAEGRNPRETALDIVGRIDKSGRRSGGVIGLHSRQAQAAQRMREELSDPTIASGYFDRALRDKNFDGRVRKAIREGKPLSRADIEVMVGRYSDIMLMKRGKQIARTETVAAFNAGRHEAMEQLIERGEVDRQAVTVEWSATMDGRTRDSHRALDGQTVRFGEAFVSPATGALMRYPGDTALGASGEDVIACRCYAAPKVNWLAMAD